MKPDDWRRSRNLTYQQLGALLGCSLQAAWNYCREQSERAFRVPPKAIIERWFEISGGAVRPEDFYRLDGSSPVADPAPAGVPSRATPAPGGEDGPNGDSGQAPGGDVGGVVRRRCLKRAMDAAGKRSPLDPETVRRRSAAAKKARASEKARKAAMQAQAPLRASKASAPRGKP